MKFFSLLFLNFTFHTSHYTFHTAHWLVRAFALEYDLEGLEDERNVVA